jgi:hypothetical protein
VKIFEPHSSMKIKQDEINNSFGATLSAFNEDLRIRSRAESTEAPGGSPRVDITAGIGSDDEWNANRRPSKFQNDAMILKYGFN